MHPFTHENVAEIFGSDAADTEDPARLYTFFVSNDSYYEVRTQNPLTLVVGQKGIGKTALMLVSSLDDRRDKFPNIFIRGSQIFSSSSGELAGSASITRFKAAIEEALVAEVVHQVSSQAAEALSAPPIVGGLIGTLAKLGTQIATGQSEAIRKAATTLAPWITKGVREINVYVDDTDVEWDGSKASADRINRLLQACFQIAADSKGDIRFKISLRSDLYNYLAVNSDIIDKVQSGVVRCRWTNDDIFRVLAKRIAVYEGRSDLDFIDTLGQEALFKELFLPYFDDKFRSVGAWENAPMRQVLLSFVRQRPRDLIGLCRLAAQDALKHGTIIDTGSLERVIPQYCNNRLNDTIVEFRNELPQVEKLLYEMRPETVKVKKGQLPPKKRNYYTHAELISKINRIKQNVNLTFSYKSIPASAPEIVEFLFRINFIVASKTGSDGHVERMYYDFSDTRLRETRLGRWDWEVHMAYRWAIQHDEAAVWQEL